MYNAEAERAAHALERAKERYGVDIPLSAFLDIQTRLGTYKTGRLHATKEGELHMVPYDNGGSRVVLLTLYNPVAGRIVTFYPPEAATKRKGTRTLGAQVGREAPYSHSPSFGKKVAAVKRRHTQDSALNRKARQEAKHPQYVMEDYDAD